MELVTDAAVTAAATTPGESSGGDLGGQQQAQQPATIKIGDQEYTISDATDLISKGQDYTRKTREAATIKAEAEALRAEAGELAMIMDTWKNQPHQRHIIVEHMAREAGIQLGQIGHGQPGASPVTNAQPSNWDELTANEQLLWRQNEEVRTQVAQVGQTLDMLKGFINEQKQDKQLQSAILGTRASIKEKFGADVSADDLREAVAYTKIPDPEAAWLKLNAGNLFKAAVTKGASQQVLEKPATPSGQGKTFDPRDVIKNGGTGHDVDRMIAEGYTPTWVPKNLKSS